MHEWHKGAIEKLKNHLEADTRYLAIIIVGSVARDEARDYTAFQSWSKNVGDWLMTIVTAYGKPCLAQNVS